MHYSIILQLPDKNFVKIRQKKGRLTAKGRFVIVAARSTKGGVASAKGRFGNSASGSSIQ